MTRKKAPKGAKILTLKVKLAEIRPPIWRRLQLVNSMTLEDLHYALQLVMGWTNSHLHEFRIGKKTYGAILPDDFGVEDLLDEKDFVLRDVFKRKGARFQYIYDFGDYWVHNIVVEEISAASPEAFYPLCLAGKRGCPPEDCGGPYGYENMLVAIRDPEHGEHEVFMEWLPEDYDPEEFVLKDANTDLHDMDLLRQLAEEGDEFGYFEEEEGKELTASPPDVPGYAGPVARLLTLGEVEVDAPPLDYLNLGICAAHVPELVKMARDMGLYWTDEESPVVWAQVHAWRALCQLRAVEAVGPLVELFEMIDRLDDDWVGADLPDALAGFGAEAVPVLACSLRDGDRGNGARVAAAETIGNIGVRHPEARDECVAALTDQLAEFKGNLEELNAFLVYFLVKLRAVESAPVMERAFAEDAVDYAVMGDWEEVQISLGLLNKRTTKKPALGWHASREANLWGSATPTFLADKKRQAAKKPRKDQKNANKKNPEK